ncbi:MAG: hypothetical protein KME21_12365 [Desmonostoc vinosum HA7617-LM4]|jgi:hypothetical protein|nr:hypothetical protein [Desmonostoc vinosum HA7617-LM4]
MSTFSVTNINDSGTGSLRQAISDANALTGKDIIKFEGIFTDKVADTITLGGSSLIITDDVSIDGSGAELLTVSGNNASRVFEIRSSATVDIEGLTITKGYISDAPDIEYDSEIYNGGGIFNRGILTVSNSIISGNRSGLYGGGIDNGDIYNTGGTLTIINSIVSDNYAQIGGGITNGGTLTVSNSTITNNSADLLGGGITNGGTMTVNNSTIISNSTKAVSSAGGGIFNQNTLTVNNTTITDNSAYNGAGIYNDGTMTVNSSTINSNSAEDKGGGIYTGNSYGGVTMTVNSSTINNNSAGQEGGGIFNYDTLTVNNSTISSNSTKYGGGIFNGNEYDDSYSYLMVSNSTIIANSGSGIENGDDAIVNNSIIAGNSLDVVGSFVSNGFNLIGNLNDSNGFDTSEQLNVPLQDVLDTTLRDNGGFTKTHALVTGSPAINTGNNADIPIDTTEPAPFDQRGSSFARIYAGRVDIGAFEAAVNVIDGTPGRNNIDGTTGNDMIIGLQGGDILTGGDGGDAFIYTSVRDAGDTITDFEVGVDKIVLQRQIFNYSDVTKINFDSAIAGGYLSFATEGSNAIVLIDVDGSLGSGRAVNFITLSHESATTLNKAVNFTF